MVVAEKPLSRDEALSIVNQMRAKGWDAGTDAVDYSDQYVVFYFRPGKATEQFITSLNQWGREQLGEWS